MSKLLGAAIVCASLMVTGAPALAQVAASPANADVARADVRRALEDASRVVGLVETATAHPRMRDAQSFDQFVAILDEQAGEIASAQAELLAIDGRITAIRAATSDQTETGRETRRQLGDIKSFVTNAWTLLDQLRSLPEDVRGGPPPCSTCANADARNAMSERWREQVRSKEGARNAVSIVNLEWGDVLHSTLASGFPETALAYAWNSGQGCYYRGLASVMRGDARLLTPSEASVRVRDVADCLMRMAETGDRALAQSGRSDTADEQAALDVFRSAATVFRRAEGDLRAGTDGMALWPTYGPEFGAIQSRLDRVNSQADARQGQ